MAKEKFERTNVYVRFGTFKFLFSHSFTCYLFD